MKGRAASSRFGPPFVLPLFLFGFSYLEGIGNTVGSKFAEFLGKRCPSQATRCISLMGDPQEVRLRIVGL
jgi:hypothetical protein